MKKTFGKFFILSICIALTMQLSYARTWRVNKLSNFNGGPLYGENYGGSLNNPVFGELSQAVIYGDVLPGDTIHLEGCPFGSSSASYSSTNVTKRLVIIGAGFFLNENPNVSNDQLTSRINSIDFNAGSAGSVLIGVWAFSPAGAGGTIDINTNNITIKRCKIDWRMALATGVTDIILNGNYFDNVVQPTFSSITISAVSGPAGLVVRNNIFKKPVLLQNGATIGTIQVCNNNIFDCPALAAAPSLKFNVAECRNNIVRKTGVLVEVTGGNITHNTSASASSLLGSAIDLNIVASNISTLFVTVGTSDGQYILNPPASSPDNIPGSDGTERGAFGGAANSNRYTLSGRAPVPVIYDISTPGVATPPLGLPVNIQARIIN